MKLENKMMPPLYLLNLLMRDFFSWDFILPKAAARSLHHKKTAHVICWDGKKKRSCHKSFLGTSGSKICTRVFMSTYLSTTSRWQKSKYLWEPQKKQWSHGSQVFNIGNLHLNKSSRFFFHLFVETERKNKQKSSEKNVDLGFKTKLGLAKSAKVHAIHVRLGAPKVWFRCFCWLPWMPCFHLSVRGSQRRISNTTPALKIWKANFLGGIVKIDIFFSMRFISGEVFWGIFWVGLNL